MKSRRRPPWSCARSAYDRDEIEFLLAMESYKRRRRRPFPTWREVLLVLKRLGYRKSTIEG